MSPVSAIILAGGRSLRMKRDKAELTYHGVSFIQHQVDKLKAAGIDDIVISGYSKPIHGTCYVPDIYPHHGPLGGVHAGLLAVKNDSSLVLSVDTPLLPVELLEELAKEHRSKITVVSCNGRLEPLIGVYDRTVADECAKILKSGNTSMRELLKTVGCHTKNYSGKEELLLNCNTPEEYEKLCDLIGT